MNVAFFTLWPIFTDKKYNNDSNVSDITFLQWKTKKKTIAFLIFKVRSKVKQWHKVAVKRYKDTNFEHFDKTTIIIKRVAIYEKVATGRYVVSAMENKDIKSSLIVRYRFIFLKYKITVL